MKKLSVIIKANDSLSRILHEREAIQKEKDKKRIIKLTEGYLHDRIKSFVKTFRASFFNQMYYQ
jgi:hypothetical protein